MNDLAFFQKMRIPSILLVCGFWLLASGAMAAPVVSNLFAVQRPGTKLVEIRYDLAATGFASVSVSLEVSGDGGASWTVPVTTVSGAVGGSVTPGVGKILVWNAGTDWPSNLNNQVKFRVTADNGFAFIPEGPFTMGRTSGDGEGNAPPVTVTVQAFYLHKTEITKAEWDEVRIWAVANGYSDLRVGAGKSPNHPVQSVSWWDAIKWCNAKSEKEGIVPCYTVGGVVLRTGTTEPSCDWRANGYRLPSEAEWEKAARGGVTGKRFPWGTDAISHGEANFTNSGTRSYAVGTIGLHPTFETGDTPYTSPSGYFAPNSFGLFDMSGNVMEWVWDWYDGSYYPTVNGSTNPSGPVSSPNGWRVRRGGWYSGDETYTRCHFRFYNTPGFNAVNTGFRPARSKLISDFVVVPGGSFTMGRTSGDTDTNAPSVSVAVSTFYMQETETTKDLWDEIQVWGLAHGYTDLTTGGGKATNHPVQTVSWWDVVKWCNARSEKEGLTPVYTVSGAIVRTGETEPEANFSANGYRLPTEAEWEKAARGGMEGKRFPWGTDTISHNDANFRNEGGEAYASGTIGHHPNYEVGDIPFTSPVGSFAKNGYGLHDMSGNVWEWCWDWYGVSSYVNGATDPRGPASGSARVLRGGRWGNVAFGCRTAYRFSYSPGYRGNNYGGGFRSARSLVTESAIDSAETDNVTVDTRDAITLTSPTDFGRVTLGRVGTQTFTLSNPGLTPVALTGNPLVEILGEHTSDFEVSVPPASEIPAGGVVSFEIRFAPTQPGARQAVVQLACASLANGPITFAIGGFGALATLKTQTITFNLPTSLYLNQGPLSLIASASSGLPVSFAVISGPAVLQGNVLTLSGSGIVQLEARQNGEGNFAAAKPVRRAITVKTDPTSLTLAHLTQTYDGTPRPVTVLGSVQPPAVSYLINNQPSAAPPTAAGSYRVSVFADGLLRKGTLVIARAPLIVQPDDKSRHLGEPNPEFTVTFSGIVPGDEPSSVLTRPISVTTKAKESSQPGVYPIISSGGAAANYTLIHRPGTLVVEGYVGSYEALLRDPVSGMAVGLLKVTVPVASRSASAKLMLSSEPAALSLAGPLVLDASRRVGSGQFSRSLRRTDTYDVTLTISVFGELSAEVRRNAVLIATSADGIRLRDKIKGETVPQAGAYTGEIRLVQVAGANDPFAPGWATAKVDAGGTMAMTGRLGDATAFTASLPVDVRGGYRFFGQPYNPARTGAHVSGTWEMEPHPTTQGKWKVEGAELIWVKAARDKDSSYRAGFGPLALELSLNRWQPASRTILLEQLLGANPFAVEYSPTGSLSETALPNQVSLNSNHTLQVLAPVTTPPNIRRWAGSVNPATGAFFGSFQLLDVTQLRTVKFSGVMRQADDVVLGQQGAGHYLLPPLKGAVNQENQTGDIRLIRLPE